MRHRGQAQEAAELYRQLTEQFAYSAEGRLALVLLARLELDRGDLVGSLRGFDAYLARGDETLREQALAGRALALGRMGQHVSECSAHTCVGKGEPLHFLTTDAPVGIEVEHDRPARRACGAHFSVELDRTFHTLERKATHFSLGWRPGRRAHEARQRLQRVTTTGSDADQLRRARQR